MRLASLYAALALNLLGASSTAFAQQSHWAGANDPVAKMMIDSERKWAEASCDHNRVAETIVAEDFWGTAPDGSRYDRTKEMEGDQARGDRDCKLDEAKVRFFGENLAMVYGSERSTHKSTDGQETGRCLVWTDTWLKRNGKWQIIAAQDTSVSCK